MLERLLNLWSARFIIKIVIKEKGDFSDARVSDFALAKISRGSKLILKYANAKNDATKICILFNQRSLSLMNSVVPKLKHKNSSRYSYTSDIFSSGNEH